MSPVGTCSVTAIPSACLIKVVTVSSYSHDSTSHSLLHLHIWSGEPPCIRPPPLTHRHSQGWVLPAPSHRQISVSSWQDKTSEEIPGDHVSSRSAWAVHSPSADLSTTVYIFCAVYGSNTRLYVLSIYCWVLIVSLSSQCLEPGSCLHIISVNTLITTVNAPACWYVTPNWSSTQCW